MGLQAFWRLSMKWLGVVFILVSGQQAIAQDDFWGSDESKSVTKGVPAIKNSEVAKPKAVTLPAPGTDTYCMPAVADPQKMIDAMKSMFPQGKLPNPSEWQAFADRVGGAHQQAAPSVEHCRPGDWISIGDKFTALEFCDFDSTPASAASFGVCRYRGKARLVREDK